MSLGKKDFSGRIAKVLKPLRPSAKSPKTLIITPKPPIPPANNTFWATYINIAGANGIENRYALYVGHLYEIRGWHVEYMGYRCDRNGVQPPKPEGGERLICRKGNRALVIQCKAFVIGGIIYLPFIYQLIAASIEYKKDNPALHVGSVFYTQHSFSNKAQLAASKFNVFLKEGFDFSYFPYVKCKAGVDGKNVHYTPYDEDYFHTDIDPQNGDMFCWDEQGAIQLGF